MKHFLEFYSNTVNLNPEFDTESRVEFDVFCRDWSSDWEFEIIAVYANGKDIYESLNMEQLSEIETEIENFEPDLDSCITDYQSSYSDYLYDQMKGN
jgi:hypothetical protein